MLKLLLLLHLLTAIFAVGPLAHAVTTASRGLRHADPVALQASSRTAKVYAAASVLVVIFGMGLMSQKRRGEELGSIGDTWIWLSLVLWAIGVAITFLVVTPSLDKAAEEISRGSGGSSSPSRGSSGPEERSGGGRIETGATPVSSYTARVAASGGVVALIFAVIVALMVYRPGS
ncbi:hypothetical protein [Flexivirga oryzae]|uniref:Putative membrane protein YgcG n=1 Tax=Flexivirga oryzae TaxID=1794944 RepID=A0A839N825_9MICO|nr:hypothetical protein [Flexivirga oryzae]MBB2890812.1 putative membrane protein YgcG [Flexivirga oryzae]